MGNRSRGKIKLDILQHIYERTADGKVYQVSKRELRKVLGLGKNITLILKELEEGRFIIHEPLPQKGKEEGDLANFYRLAEDGFKVITESKDLFLRLLLKLS